MLRTLAIILFMFPLPASAEGLDLASQVEGLTAAALSDLPPNPSGRVDPGACVALLSAPASADGKAVAALGWGVTGEAMGGGLTFVSFAGRALQGTSGSCVIEEGNLGVFLEGRLQGVIYAPDGTRRAVGSIEAGESFLRIWDGDFLPRPLADIRVFAPGLVIAAPLAHRDPACRGTVGTQNIYDLPIHLARRLLFTEGWQPQPALPEDQAAMWPWVLDLQAGLPEVKGCGGTGFAYCSFAYRHPGGALLSVTTAGEAEPPDSPSVVGYGVTCPAGTGG